MQPMKNIYHFFTHSSAEFFTISQSSPNLLQERQLNAVVIATRAENANNTLILGGYYKELLISN